MDIQALILGLHQMAHHKESCALIQRVIGANKDNTKLLAEALNVLKNWLNILFLPHNTTPNFVDGGGES
jgi:hypothetical protein